ncbi:hypothetical protein MO867_22220, partial [Microbulbifer sp. OS29]
AHPAAVTETWTITCTDATLPATFSVQGSISGVQASAIVGTHYDNALVLFDLAAGDTDYQVGDRFEFDVTAGEMPTDERWEVLRIGGVAGIEASSYRTDSEPWRIFKGPYHEHSNSWATAIGEHENCWISWKFFRPYEISRIEIQAPGTNTQAPNSFALEWSDDEITWHQREAFSGITWSDNESKELTLGGVSPGAKLYWRITISSNNGSTDTTGLQQVGFLEFQNTADINSGRMAAAWLRAPGLTGNGSVYLNFQTYDRPTDDYFNLAIAGATGFIDDSDFDSQPGSEEMGLPLWNQDMEYWAAVDGQHIALNVRVDINVFPIYLGKMLPFGTPG